MTTFVEADVEWAKQKAGGGAAVVGGQWIVDSDCAGR